MHTRWARTFGRPLALSRFGIVTLIALATALGCAEPPAEVQARLRAPPVEAKAPPARVAEPTGPIPDYAPVGRVLTHTQLDELSPGLGRVLDEVVGPRHVIEHYDPGTQETPESPWTEDAMLMWMRDYQPIYVRRPDGGLKIIRYLDPNPNRAHYLPEAPTAGAEPIEVELLPLIHENGNFIVTDRYVFVSERLLLDNQERHDDEHLVAAGYQERDPDTVVAMLARSLERSPSDIVVLPQMPHEGTGHVDLFLMALGPRMMMIPEIRHEALRAVEDPEDRGLALQAQAFLDAQAQLIADLGLEVVRLPMLAPTYMQSVDDVTTRDAVFYTPANGLLLRTESTSTIIVPTMSDAGVDPAVRALNRRYQREWVDRLGHHGWTVRLLDATELGRYLGLFRCVSATVPS